MTADKTVKTIEREKKVLRRNAWAELCCYIA
jgi:hypothetical protein